jgi:hypothetical protein
MLKSPSLLKLRLKEAHSWIVAGSAAPHCTKFRILFTKASPPSCNFSCRSSQAFEAATSSTALTARSSAEALAALSLFPEAPAAFEELAMAQKEVLGAEG